MVGRRPGEDASVRRALPLLPALLPWLACCVGGCVGAAGDGAADGGPRPGAGADAGSAVPEVPPRLRVEAPVPGSFHGADDVVTVGGQASAGSAPLARLLLDGQPVPFGEDGRFAVAQEHGPEGLDLVELRVEDQAGGRAVDTVAYQRGTVNPPGAWLPGALILRGSQQFLDDRDPDPDDVASLLARMIVDPSFTALLLQPYTVLGTAITPTAIAVQGAEVTLELTPPSLLFSVVLAGVSAEFAGGSGGFDLGGRMSADVLACSARLTPALGEDGAVAVTVTDVLVEQPEGFVLELNLADSWPEPLRAVLSDSMKNYLIGQLEQELGPLLGEKLSSLLQAFALEGAYGTIDPVSYQLRLDGLEVQPAGLVIRMAARVDAVSRREDLPPGAGSLHTDGDPPTQLDDAEPVLVVVDDDLLNQALFAAYSSGALSNWTFLPADLARAGEELAQIPAPFGPLHSLTLDGLLPFSLVRPAGDFLFDIGIGDLRLLVERDDGVRLGLRLGVVAGARLVFEGQGLGLQLDDRPRWLRVAVGVDEAPSGLDPGNLAALARLMVPPFLGQANRLATLAEIPGIPLSSLGSAAFLQGKTMRLGVSRAARTGAQGTHLLVAGTLSWESE